MDYFVKLIGHYLSALKSLAVRESAPVRTGIALLPVALCALLGAPQAAMAQAQVKGQWQTQPYLMPINPIRVALLHSGQIVIVSGSENNPTEHNQGTSVGALWDLKVPSVSVIPMLWDVFCNGGTILPDGRCLVVGGTDQYDPFYGDPRVTIFDPKTDLFNQLQSMADGRWYATAITLADGRAMVFSGLNDDGGTNQTVELYTVASGWSSPFNAGWTPPLYPWLHVLPSGKVFYSGCTALTRLFDPTNPGAGWTNVASTVFGLTRTYGSSVLLPLLPSNNYAPRVMILGGGQPNATNTTEIIDLSKTTPAWASSGNMPSGARVECNAVLLPTGKLLVQGGSAVDEDGTTATLGADLYDPTTGTWSSAGTASFARLYHSIALLLPDATVVTAGSNPTRGTYEQHIEIYSPAYLFTTDGNGNTISATRPVISSSPANIGYAGAFQVQTPNAASVSSVVIIRAGSDTHAFDMDQRLVGLTFTAGSGVLNVTGPPNANIAPPGYYMLFLVNSAGVPSVANFVQVSKSPTDQPPKGTITSPATNLTIGLGQSVTFSGTATDADGTISSAQWVFPEGNPGTSMSLSAGSVSFTSPGTYVASLTAVDNLGVNDPSPPLRTITVQSTAGGTPTYVQGNYAVPQTPQTTVMLPFTTAQTAGNLNVAIVGWNNTTAKVSSVTDTAGNVYTLAVGPTLQAGNLSQSIYYAKSIAAAAAGANSLKVVFTAAATWPDIRIMEYSGIDPANPLDGATGASGTSATSSTGALVTTRTTDLLVGANIVGTTTIGPGANFNQRLLTFPDGDIAEDRLVTANGSYTASAPLSSSGPWVMNLAAFAASSSATIPPPPPPPPAGPKFVQGNYAVPQTPQTTVTIPYTGAQTVGDLNVVIVGWNDTIAQVSSVADSKGNVYQLAVGPTLLSGALSQSIYYAKNISPATAGGNAVTVTFNKAATWVDARILEYSGLDQTKPLDTSVAAVGNGTNSTSNSGVLTTTFATDLLVGANIVTTTTGGAGTGYTQRLLTNPDGDIAEDTVVTTAGTYSATAPLTGGSGGWIMQLVAFKALGGGG
jgi:hypothetical protein